MGGSPPWEFEAKLGDMGSVFTGWLLEASCEQMVSIFRIASLSKFNANAATDRKQWRLSGWQNSQGEAGVKLPKQHGGWESLHKFSNAPIWSKFTAGDYKAEAAFKARHSSEKNTKLETGHIIRNRNKSKETETKKISGYTVQKRLQWAEDGVRWRRRFLHVTVSSCHVSYCKTGLLFFLFCLFFFN